MPPLKVPEQYRAGIVRTAMLSKAAFDQLISALRSAPACKDQRELLTWIGSETALIAEVDRQAIIGSIVPMFRVQRNAEVSASDFAVDVWNSFVTNAPKDVESIERQDFISRITLLIEQSSLDLASSRVSDVKREVERNFCKIRILTDLRPAFKQNLEDPPTDMAIIHNFQIGYHDGMANHKEFYVSLDHEDLQKLKKAISDAESKSKALEDALGKTGIRLHK